ncbi:MAG: DNA polymerase III subunit delta [Clostridiales bacterium]|nr:DNA polymerase III subunit delta [Clostridiales bacterium]
MKFKDLKKSLTTNLSSCYLLSCGSDEEDLYLKASAKNNIIKAAINGFLDLNLSIFSTENLDVNNFKKALETMPFMNDKRVVLLLENEGRKNENLLKFLMEYLTKMNSSTILIIDANLNSNFKSLEKLESVNVVDCSRLDRDILTSFIIKNCKSKNVEIESKAVDKLIDFCDGYMVKINLELDKIISFKLNEKQIFEKDIEENVVKSEEYQIFELTNALFSKNSDKALFIVDDIIKNKKNINMILNLVYNHIRRLFYVKISKTSTLELSKMLEIKEFAVKKLVETAKNMSAKKLRQVLSLCEETDFNIKSGNLDLISGIYNLIFTILI